MALLLEARTSPPATCPAVPPRPVFLSLCSELLDVEYQGRASVGTENGIESGDEQKLEHQPGRDMASDKNQRARTRRRTPYKPHKTGLCVEPALPGVEEVAWPGCFQEFPSGSGPVCCQLSLPAGVGLQAGTYCGISRGGIWLSNKFH